MHSAESGKADMPNRFSKDACCGTTVREQSVWQQGGVMRKSDRIDPAACDFPARATGTLTDRSLGAMLQKQNIRKGGDRRVLAQPVFV
jgi:hypothetical protein